MTYYQFCKEVLDADFDMAPWRFLNQEKMLTPDNVAKVLVDEYGCAPADAPGVALRWCQEPRNAIHVDPFSLPQ